VNDDAHLELLAELRRLNRELARHGCPRDTLTSPHAVESLDEVELGMLVRAEGRRLAKLRQVQSETL
jgi:hypothetical protein